MASKYAVTAETFIDVYKYPYKYNIHPFRIASNLYYVGNTSVGSHLLDTGDGLILLDTTFPQSYPLLINSIWEMGFSPYDIKYILHSHGHFDHFGGTNCLVTLTGAKTFLGSEDAKMFRERPELALLRDCPYSYTELFTPDVELHDGDVITLGNTTIRAMCTPGHSPGVMSYFIQLPEENGKSYVAAMHGGAGFNTLNEEFLQEFQLDAQETRRQFLDGLDHVFDEHVDILLGNHPNQNDTVGKRQRMLEHPDGPNPFVDPGEWQRYLTDIRDRFAIMLAEEAAGTASV